MDVGLLKGTIAHYISLCLEGNWHFWFCISVVNAKPSFPGNCAHTQAAGSTPGLERRGPFCEPLVALTKKSVLGAEEGGAVQGVLTGSGVGKRAPKSRLQISFSGSLTESRKDHFCLDFGGN